MWPLQSMPRPELLHQFFDVGPHVFPLKPFTRVPFFYFSALSGGIDSDFWFSPLAPIDSAGRRGPCSYSTQHAQGRFPKSLVRLDDRT